MIRIFCSEKKIHEPPNGMQFFLLCLGFMIISHPLLLHHVKQWFGPFRGTDSLVPEGTAGATISTGMCRRKAYYVVISILCTERNKTINVPFFTVYYISIFQRK